MEVDVDGWQELMVDLDIAVKALDTARIALDSARSEENRCLNNYNTVCKRIEAYVENRMEEAPHGTDWARKRQKRDPF